jgi:hypothetical protein
MSTIPMVSMSITTSFVSQIIVDLSTRFGQTPEMKRSVNNSITRSGHGSIILGSSARLEGGDRNIRMLVGAHFSRHNKLKIGTFGGKCNGGEITINTVIRETIEEVFNLSLENEQEILDSIRHYLETNTDLYFISQVSEQSVAFAYIFDVSILGAFIRIINDIGSRKNIAYYIPTNDSLVNIDRYLQSNVQFTDLSSFNGQNQQYGSEATTISLVEFMRERYISHKLTGTYRRLHSRSSGLDEIKYLSFVSLHKLAAAAPRGRYDLYNFVRHRRENLQMQYFLGNLLQKDVMRFILSYQ